MAISEVVRVNNYYHVINEKGQRVCQYQSSVGELQGFNAEYIVLRRGNTYVVCDERFKQISMRSKSAMGEFLNITDRIHCKRGGYIVSYDENLHEISQRQDIK